MAQHLEATPGKTDPQKAQLLLPLYRDHFNLASESLHKLHTRYASENYAGATVLNNVL